MIAIDWGTSSLRAYRLADDGTILARHAAARGILTVEDQNFAGCLRAEIGPWLDQGETRVLMSGMIGSRQGWVEAPYLPCPASADDLAGALLRVVFDGAELRLVPGLSDRDEAGTPEVMRGEETQIAGMAFEPGEAIACLPGSHAKWARIEGGRIVSFRTYLSGEAFSALRHGTILGRMMPDGPTDPEAFDRGVARAGEPGHLLHHLFGVRALGLFGRLAEADAAAYFSGLLIGHEVLAAVSRGWTVHLIGAPELCALYARAIAAAGGKPVIAAEDAAARGLAAIGRRAAWT